MKINSVHLVTTLSNHVPKLFFSPFPLSDNIKRCDIIPCLQWYEMHTVLLRESGCIPMLILKKKKKKKKKDSLNFSKQMFTDVMEILKISTITQRSSNSITKTLHTHTLVQPIFIYTRFWSEQTLFSNWVSKRPRGRAASAPDFGSRGRGFESRWRRDSSRT